MWKLFGSIARHFFFGKTSFPPPPPTTQARIILKGEGEVNCLNLLITALRQDNLYTEMTLEFENGQNYNFGGREEDISKQRWVERHLSNPYLVPTCLT